MVLSCKRQGFDNVHDFSVRIEVTILRWLGASGGCARLLCAGASIDCCRSQTTSSPKVKAVLSKPLQVHRSTGEGPEEVAARKRSAAWGAWLDVPFDAEAAAAAREAAAAAEEAEEGGEGGSSGEPAAAAAAVQLEQPRRRSGRRSSAAKAAAAAAGGSKQRAALPEGAGAALLVWAAVRWHRLSAAFCAAAQVRARSVGRRLPCVRACLLGCATASHSSPAPVQRAEARTRLAHKILAPDHLRLCSFSPQQKLAAAPAPKPVAATKRPAPKQQPAAQQQPKQAAKRPASKSKAAVPAAAAAAPRRSGRGQQAQQAQQAQLPSKVTAFFQPSGQKQPTAAAAAKAAAAVLAAAEAAAKHAKVAAAEPPRPQGRLGMRARK